jgi:hypothetical protein
MDPRTSRLRPALPASLASPAVATRAVALYYAWGAIVLWQTYGHYRPLYLASFFAAWLASMALAARGESRRLDPSPLPARWLWLWCGAMPLVWWIDVVLLYPDPGPAFAAFRATGALASALVATSAIGVSREVDHTRSRLPEHLLTAAIGVCLVAKLLVLRVTPSPFIDVFRWLTEASDHLLAGRDPYSQVYEDLYAGKYDHRPGMPYWPATLLVATVSRAMTGDVRTGFVLSQALACAAIYGVARDRGADREEGRLYVLAWLVHPVGFLVHEQSWVDPLLVATFAWLALWLGRRQLLAAAVGMGLAIVFKQYGALGAAVTLAYVWRAHGARPALRALAVAAAVVALLLVPFLVWDARGFYRMTVRVPATQLLRPDALSLLAPLAKVLPPAWPSRITALVAGGSVALASAWSWRRESLDVRTWALAVAFVYGLFFFFSKLAFCNYHWFAAFFPLLYVVMGRLTTLSGRGNRSP